MPTYYITFFLYYSYRTRDAPDTGTGSDCAGDPAGQISGQFKSRKLFTVQ